MSDIVKNSLQEAAAAMARFAADPSAARAVTDASEAIAEALRSGGKVITCGNGGSLCDATHFAEELTGRFRGDRRPLPAIAINDPAHITCVANDFGFDEVFSRYVEALGKTGDVLVAFSTSGNSANVVKAARVAKDRGMKVVAMTRSGENRLSALADITVGAEHDGYADRIQEIHITAVHIIIENVEHLLGVK